MNCDIWIVTNCYGSLLIGMFNDRRLGLAQDDKCQKESELTLPNHTLPVWPNRHNFCRELNQLYFLAELYFFTLLSYCT
jgi:hypothetical protein